MKSVASRASWKSLEELNSVASRASWKLLEEVKSGKEKSVKSTVINRAFTHPTLPHATGSEERIGKYVCKTLTYPT